MAVTLQQVQADEATLTSAVASTVTLVQSLQTTIQQLQAGGGASAADLAALDAQITANNTALAALSPIQPSAPVANATSNGATAQANAKS